MPCAACCMPVHFKDRALLGSCSVNAEYDPKEWGSGTGGVVMNQNRTFEQNRCSLADDIITSDLRD
eukprot:scaffold17461_cov148-Skeletonema_marinoi.AAC.2